MAEQQSLLLAFQVGDNDVVAHFSAEEARAFLMKEYGYSEDDLPPDSVELASDAFLDGEMRDEGGKICTTLREDLRAATEPCLLHSWE